MSLPAVLPQQVPAEITVEIPPYGVDMIGTQKAGRRCEQVPIDDGDVKG